MKNTLLILFILFYPIISFSAPDTEKSYHENTCRILCEDSKERASSNASSLRKQCSNDSSACSKAYKQAKETCESLCDSEKNSEFLLCSALPESAEQQCKVDAINKQVTCISSCRQADYNITECNEAKASCDKSSEAEGENERQSKRDCSAECKTK